MSDFRTLKSMLKEVVWTKMLRAKLGHFETFANESNPFYAESAADPLAQQDVTEVVGVYSYSVISKKSVYIA